MSLVRRLWADEAGFIISAELCLVATIVVIGLIVGLVTLRNQVVQELIAVGEAIGSINTSYAFAVSRRALVNPVCLDGRIFVD